MAKAQKYETESRDRLVWLLSELESEIYDNDGNKINPRTGLLEEIKAMQNRISQWHKQNPRYADMLRAARLEVFQRNHFCA